jgi:hypothetical protein
VRRILLVLVAVVFVATAVLAFRYRRSSADKPTPVELWSLDQAIDESADYLARVNNEEGRFEYRLFSDGRHGNPKKYNILRHAGAIYALGDYTTQASAPEKRAKAGATAARAEKYLLGHYTRALREHPDVKGVWSDPKEEGGQRPGIKLGANGLSIIGIMSKMRAGEVPGAIDGVTPELKADEIATAQALARFVGLAEKPQGDFRGKYDDDKGFMGDSDSLYYPGEAILGLTMLYERDRDPQWLSLGVKAIQYLIESRRSVKKIPNDHWLMIAIDRLDPVYGDIPNPPLSRDAIVEHSIAVGKSMLDDMANVDAKGGNAADLDGSFNLDGRTTPNATRLEGLLALEHTLGAFPKHAEFRKKLRLAIGRGVAFLRRAQIRDGIARGGMPAAVRAVASSEDSADDEKHDAGAGGEENEVRIDYVQHAMSALMKYRTMCAASGGGDGCAAH